MIRRTSEVSATATRPLDGRTTVPALEVRNTRKAFGAIQAVNGCSISLPQGVIVGLVGPNGSGKSTLIECISGLQRFDSGEVLLHGKSIDHLEPYRRARLGLRRSFQVSRLWRRLSVAENLLAAAPVRGRDTLWRVYFSRGQIREVERETKEKAKAILLKYNLWDLRNERAGSLSGGQSRLLEFARIMISEGSVALLDEPLAGVNPVMAENVADGIRELQAAGMTILLVEHDLGFVGDMCQTVHAMDRGTIELSGTIDEVASSEFFARSYIGGSIGQEGPDGS
jgi:ABC-type branched-subunit amino acid transport system ATPase component